MEMRGKLCRSWFFEILRWRSLPSVKPLKPASLASIRDPEVQNRLPARNSQLTFCAERGKYEPSGFPLSPKNYFPVLVPGVNLRWV